MNILHEDISNNILRLGDLYYGPTSDKPLRIIGFDNAEVFYDAQWSDESWTFSGNFKRKGFFYRMPAKIFIKHYNKIGTLPLSSEELAAFRPDLPMRILRTKNLNWNDFLVNDQDKFLDYIHESLDGDSQNQIIKSNKIVLVPLGRKGGLKKGVSISADNSFYFTPTEIIWKAKEIQESQNDEKSHGIGIYRLGFEKGIPSYKIGEYTNEYISTLGID
jgi:hypothetical protein